MGFGWRTLLGEFVDVVYPNLCPLCHATAEGLGCAEHRLGDGGAVVRGPAGARCRRCFERLPPALPDGELCARCRRDGSSPKVRALFDYHRDARAREWILAFKHGGRPDLARCLGGLLAAYLETLERDGDFRRGDESAPPERWFVPVPAHPLRRLERGYDQARLLAKGVAQSLGGRWVPALRRRRWTPPQGAPGARSRSANVRDAFRLVAHHRPRLRGLRVWLVDDVVVSGATVRACRDALRPAGASSISVLALARADRDLTAERKGVQMPG